MEEAKMELFKTIKCPDNQVKIISLEKLLNPY